MQTKFGSFRICDRPSPGLEDGRLAKSLDANSVGPNWPELFWDLGSLGEVWVDTQISALTLSHRTTVNGFRVYENLAHLQGSDFAIRLLLELCCTASASAHKGSAIDYLSIKDHWNRELLGLRTEAKEGDRGLLLGAFEEIHRRMLTNAAPTMSRESECSEVEGAQYVAANTLRARYGAIDDGIDLFEMTQVCTPSHRHPESLREYGQATCVDLDMVPALIETLADLILPIRIITGNNALVRRVDFSPCSAYHAQGILMLQGDGVFLRLNTEYIDSAWVFQPTGDADRRRTVRLYDAGGRVIVVLSARPTAKDAEPPVWRTLVNALMD